MIEQDGEWIPIKMPIPDVTCELEGARYTEKISPYSIFGKLPRRPRRKRLIKLLMSIGYSRNDAVAIAKEYHDLGVSYGIAWLMYCF